MHCNSQNTTSAAIYQKIAHVFWMPVFPMGKTGGTECSHCKQILREKELSSDIKPAYDQLKATAKAPISVYWGAAVLILLAILGQFVGKDN
jgi:hypothetical protein